MCKGGSTNTTTNTTVNSPPPEVMQAYTNLINVGQQVASQPYQQYNAPLVAGFTPDQMQAFQNIQNAQGLSAPYTNAATQYAGIAGQPNNIPQLNQNQMGALANGAYSGITNSTSPLQVSSLNQGLMNSLPGQGLSQLGQSTQNINGQVPQVGNSALYGALNQGLGLTNSSAQNVASGSPQMDPSQMMNLANGAVGLTNSSAQNPLSGVAQMSPWQSQMMANQGLGYAGQAAQNINYPQMSAQDLNSLLSGGSNLLGQSAGNVLNGVPQANLNTLQGYQNQGLGLAGQATQNIGSYVPQMSGGQLSGLPGQGLNALNSSGQNLLNGVPQLGQSQTQGLANQGLNYANQAGQNINGQVTQADPNQLSSLPGQGLGLAQQAAQSIAGQLPQYNAQTLGQYQDPYTNSVINSTMATMNEQDAQQQQQLLGNSIMQGAFGGDREAVMRAQLAGQQAQARDQTIAGLQSQGFQNAQNQLAQQQQIQSNALQAGQSLAGQSANQMLNFFSGQQGLQSQNAQATQGLQAGLSNSLLGQYNQQQNLGLQGNLGTQQLQQSLGNSLLGQFNTQQNLASQDQQATQGLQAQVSNNLLNQYANQFGQQQNVNLQGNLGTQGLQQSAANQLLGLYSGQQGLAEQAQATSQGLQSQVAGQLLGQYNNQQNLGLQGNIAGQQLQQSAGQNLYNMFSGQQQFGANTNAQTQQLQQSAAQQLYNLFGGQQQLQSQNAQATQGLQQNAANSLLGLYQGQQGMQNTVGQENNANQLAAGNSLANLYQGQQNLGLNASNANAQNALGAGQLIGNLGTQAQANALQGASAQLQAGTQQQQLAQQQLNVPYQQFQAQQQYPIQMAQLMAMLTTGAGSQMGGTSTATQTSPGASPLSQIAGLAMAAAPFIMKNGGLVGYDTGGTVNDDPDVKVFDQGLAAKGYGFGLPQINQQAFQNRPASGSYFNPLPQMSAQSLMPAGESPFTVVPPLSAFQDLKPITYTPPSATPSKGSGGSSRALTGALFGLGFMKDGGAAKYALGGFGMNDDDEGDEDGLGHALGLSAGVPDVSQGIQNFKPSYGLQMPGEKQGGLGIPQAQIQQPANDQDSGLNSLAGIAKTASALAGKSAGLGAAPADDSEALPGEIAQATGTDGGGGIWGKLSGNGDPMSSPLLYAGLGMLSSNSPNFGQALGQGALTGLQAYGQAQNAKELAEYRKHQLDPKPIVDKSGPMTRLYQFINGKWTSSDLAPNPDWVDPHTKTTTVHAGDVVLGPDNKPVYTAPDKPTAGNKLRTYDSGSVRITEEFDPATDAWNEKARSPIGGGDGSASNRPIPISPGTTLYDPQTHKPIYTAPPAAKPDRGLPTKAINDLSSAGTQLATIDRLNNGFQDKYGGHTFTGDWSNWAGRNFGDDTGQTQWWQDYQNILNQTRQQLFGSALTETEKGEFEKAQINPRMNPDQIRANLSRQKRAADSAALKLAKGYTASGYDQDAIEGALGTTMDDLESANIPTVGTPEEAMKLKPGTKFRTPDGRVKVR